MQKFYKIQSSKMIQKERTLTLSSFEIYYKATNIKHQITKCDTKIRRDIQIQWKKIENVEINPSFRVK